MRYIPLANLKNTTGIVATCMQQSLQQDLQQLALLRLSRQNSM